jgi:hypothetical protein
MTNALAIYAGRKAQAHIAKNGLNAADVRVVSGAAGGPKGLLLLELDKFIFGEWLPTSNQPVDLLGASIGAWRMATACMADSSAGFDRLARDYIAQDYEATYNSRGKRVMPPAQLISDEFGKALSSFYDGHLGEILNHPRYRLHIITSRGRGFLRQVDATKRLEPRVVLGFAAAFFANVVNRRAMGALIERTVFSTSNHASHQSDLHAMPFKANDYSTSQQPLVEANFHAALQASCSIPFVLNAINDIPQAPKGSYWDGGMTDYHCHMNYADVLRDDEIVLVPHFQQHLVAGWLDKSLKWRHHSTAFLDNVVVLAPTPSFVAGLPNRKIPDREDFKTYMDDWAGRVAVWRNAVMRSHQLVEEFKTLLLVQNTSIIQSL